MKQIDLFEFQEAALEYMDIKNAANVLNASEASIKNWIKADYLAYRKGMGISIASIEQFLKNIAGIEKLNKRANKSLLDKHDHDAVIENVIQNITKPNISDIYQESLSLAYRNKEGIYYTPEHICSTMFLDVPKPGVDATFCDPCCGGGHFIMQAIKHGFRVENIYGFDIDPVAVKITQQRIFQTTGIRSENIHRLDFLALVKNNVYDYILTNPPWGKKFEKDRKNEFFKNFNIVGSVDSSALFFLASLKALKEKGHLAFLVPDAFLKIASFGMAREQILNHTVISFRNFKNPFKGIQAQAHSFCIKKNKPSNRGDIICAHENIVFMREQASFLKNPKRIINFCTHPEENKVIDAVYKKPCIHLKGNARWGLGIVTGNNNKFCHPQMRDGLVPVYRGMDIHADHLDRATNFISNDMSLYQQVPPMDILEAEEKIVYRFISSNLIFYHDRKQCYFLNSANMMVLNAQCPVAIDYVVWLFNTPLYNWLFQKIFNTHKVLRSDLEEMPIPVDFFHEKEETEDRLLQYFSIKKMQDGTYRTQG